MNLAAKNAKCAKKAWPMVRLGDVCDIIAGQSPEGVNYTGDPSFVEFHQGCKAFGNKYLESSGIYTKVVTKIAKSGSILMSVRAPVGTLNITQRDVCIGRGLAAFNACESLNQDYLYFCLLAGNEKLNKVAGAGTVFPSISRSQLASFTFSLPPLTVQREIVARLEKELGEADALAAKFKEIAENADAEFKAELDGTFKNVEGEKVRLGDVCGIDGSLVTDYERYAKYPHIGIDCIEKTTGRILGYRTVEEDNVRSGKYYFTRQHIIYSKIRPNLNKVAVPEFDGLCSADSYPLLPKETCDRYWLAYMMRSKRFLEYVVPISNNRTGMPKVNRSEVLAFTFTIPPLEAQRAIVGKLDSAKDKCEKLKAAAERGLRAAEDLRKAILAEAFEQ